jgi:Flp pilus assembly protein TadG
MNNLNTRTNPFRLSRRGQRGSSVIELALMIPVLALLAFGTADFARISYAAVEIHAAARAGAQYGSQSVVTAADSAGMIAAAKADAPDLTGVTATASQCSCATGSSVASCTASYCTNNPNANFITVNAQFPFSTIAPYPGIPSSVTIYSKSIMMVGQ